MQPRFSYLRYRFALATLIFFTAGFTHNSSAQEWAKERLETSPRHHEYVLVQQGDRTLNCFIALPESTENASVVIVIHDISALGEWICGVCDQLAEAGYVAIVPDLVSGLGPDGGGTESFATIEDVRAEVAKLPRDQITADLTAVADYAAQRLGNEVKISVAGFCWGGGQTLRYATANQSLAAAFVFYGYQPVDAQEIENITCPVYGFYGETDATINQSLPALTELMDQADKTFEPVMYEGVGHCFLRHGEDPNGTEAEKRVRLEAWERWKGILQEL